MPILLVFLLIPGVTRDVSAAEKLDKKTIKEIQDLAARWFAARPKTYFESWDRDKRKALMDEARALGAMPEGGLAEVVELLWKKGVKKNAPKFKKKMDTPYGEAIWDQSGAGGKKSGLVLALHGGGVGAGNKSEAFGKWKVAGNMTIAPQGIRLIHDTWNSVHGERFLLTLIEFAKARYEIDPDRVYSMGFSMGGTGSLFMSGRHPDLLAGAIPAHGILSARGGVKTKSVEETGELEHGTMPNLRNLAVYIYTGLLDVNCEPWTYIKMWNHIQELKKKDPTGYQLLRFKAHEGIAHSFPPGEPGTGIKWISEQKRNTFPDTLVWEYNNAPWIPKDREDKVDRYIKKWFYWLHCQRPEDYMVVRATIRKTETTNRIELTVGKPAFPEDFTIYLNDEMIDVHRDTVLVVDGEEVYRGRPQPNVATVFDSLDARLDRSMVFDRKIQVPEEG